MGHNGMTIEEIAEARLTEEEYNDIMDMEE